MSCEFCNIEDEKKYLVVATNDSSIAFVCIEPLREGHLLVIPRRHVKELHELPEKELADMIKLLGKAESMLEKTYDTTAGFSYMKHGTAKSVEHLHMHLIPGFIPIRKALSEFGVSPKPRDRRPFEELAGVAKKIKKGGMS